jgi:ATP-dependent RNA helicase RhlE
MSFVDGETLKELKDIEKLIGKKIPVIEDHPFPFTGVVPEPTPAKPAQKPASQSGNRSSDKNRKNRWRR